MEKLQEKLAEGERALEASERARRLAELMVENLRRQITRTNEMMRLTLAQNNKLLAQHVEPGTPAPPGCVDTLPAPQSPSLMPGPSQADSPATTQALTRPENGQLINAVTMNLASIPVYSGESREVSVEQFIKALKSFVRANKTLPSLLLAILDGRTEGRANDLVQRLTPQQLGSLSEIEKAFRQEFKDDRTVFLMEQRIATTKHLPGEDVANYYTRVQKAVDRLCDITPRHPSMTDTAWTGFWERRLFNAFLSGLRPGIFTFVLGKKPANIHQARDAAAAAEEAQDEGRTPQGGFSQLNSANQGEGTRGHLTSVTAPKNRAVSWRQVDVPRAVTQGQNPGSAVVSSLQTQPGSLPHAQGLSAALRGQENLPEQANPVPGLGSASWNNCFICRLDGHWVKDCPYKSCGACDQKGHLPFECAQLHTRH
jgi:hypothetical protein